MRESVLQICLPYGERALVFCRKKQKQKDKIYIYLGTQHIKNQTIHGDMAKCPAHCPCWARARLPEPVTDTEKELAEQIRFFASMRNRRALAGLVQNIAARVARGDLDKHRMAILLSPLYEGRPRCTPYKTVLAILRPRTYEATTGKFPHGVPELIGLGVSEEGVVQVVARTAHVSIAIGAG